MPYRMSKDEMCVEKKDGDKWVEEKCFDTKKKAEAHMAALNQNVMDKESLTPAAGQVQEAGDSKEDFINQVRQAFDKHCRMMDLGVWCWVVDTFDDHLICRMDDKYFLVTMTVTGDEIKFADRADWQKVKLDYVSAETAPAEAGTDAMQEAVREAVSLTVQLAEASKENDGLFPDSVIVVEGLSANQNEYTRSALRSGVNIFEGARLVADHELDEGQSKRPEGSIHDVIGKVTNVRLGERDNHSLLLGDVFISESETKIRTKVKEGILGDLSIKAWGSGVRAKDGHFVVEAFEEHPYTNIAMVTIGAAGGKLVSESQQAALQALHSKDVSSQDVSSQDVSSQDVSSQDVSSQDATPKPGGTPEEGDTSSNAEAVTEAPRGTPRREVRVLRESEQVELTEVVAERDRLLEENARLFRQVRTGQAERLLAEAVKKAGALPAATLKRIADLTKPQVESFATHGSTQTDAELSAALSLVVEAEKTYLATIVPNGAVVGVTLPGGEGGADAILAEAFTGLVPDDQVDVAVRGRG